MVNIKRVICLALMTAVAASASTTNFFTGANPGYGLDLDGTFLYAINVGSGGAYGSSPNYQVGAAVFRDDWNGNIGYLIGGVMCNYINYDAYGIKPEYGGNPYDGYNEDNLENVLFSIGYGNVTHILAVTPGQAYKIQLLYSENVYGGLSNPTATRAFGLSLYDAVNGTLYDTAELVLPSFWWSPAPDEGVVVTMGFTAESNSITITHYPGTTGTDNNPILNALTVEVVNSAWAWDPDPNYGANVVATTELSWNTGLNQNDPCRPPHPGITGHFVYVSKSKSVIEAATPSNHSGVGYYKYQPVGDTTYQPSVDGSGPLDVNATYYWKVDERFTSDSNIVTGNIWSFKVVPPLPIIEEQPMNVEAYPGEEPTFTVVAYNPYKGHTNDLSYQWYKVPSTMLSDGARYNGVNTATLMILDTNYTNPDNDEGEYFCRITMTYGSSNSKDTNSASLFVKRKVGYWPFDGNMDDAAGSNNGTWMGDDSPTYVAGRVGSHSLQFDVGDPNDYVDIPVAAIPQGGGQISISLWVNNAPIKDMTVFCAYNDNHKRIIASDLTLSNSYVYWDAGNDTSYDRILKLIDYAELEGTWNHFVFTKGEGEMNIYKNGELWQSGTGNIDISGATSFRIGGGLTPEKSYEGLIDDFCIYNYCLTAEEVARIYYDITGKSSCTDRPVYDASGPNGKPDCVVNMFDFAALAEDWMKCGKIPQSSCP